MFSGMWASLVYGEEDAPASDDGVASSSGLQQDDVAELENQSFVIDTASVGPLEPRRPRSVLYRRELMLNCALANDDSKEPASASNSVACAFAHVDDEDDEDVAARERDWSSKIDEQILLADLLHSSNRLDRDSLRASDSGGG